MVRNIVYLLQKTERGGGEKNMEVMDSPGREMNSTKEQCGLYNYIITDAQKEFICRHFGKDSKELEN